MPQPTSPTAPRAGAAPHAATPCWARGTHYLPPHAPPVGSTVPHCSCCTTTHLPARFPPIPHRLQLAQACLVSPPCWLPPATTPWRVRGATPASTTPMAFTIAYYRALAAWRTRQNFAGRLFDWDRTPNSAPGRLPTLPVYSAVLRFGHQFWVPATRVCDGRRPCKCEPTRTTPRHKDSFLTVDYPFAAGERRDTTPRHYCPARHLLPSGEPCREYTLPFCTTFLTSACGFRTCSPVYLVPTT